MADDSDEQPILKRRRVSAACNSCRAKKSKCDGKRPICGRCAGYDYPCSWGSEALQHERTRPNEDVTEIFERYHKALNTLASGLTPDDRAEVTKSLACIRIHLFPRQSSEVSSTVRHNSHGKDHVPIERLQSPRFVGEVSDVHFFNLVRQTTTIQSNDAQNEDGEVDNYDTEALTTMDYLQNPLSDMPERAQVEKFLNIYFSTIHVAYPFVNKASFMVKLNTLQTEGPTTDLTHSWLSLLCKLRSSYQPFSWCTGLTHSDALLAIGASYDSFRSDSDTDGSAHQKLLQRSLVLSRHEMLERSLTQVSAILAQCFYLLSTSDIDRCWAYLGLAIRLAQSIGLHADVQDHGLARTCGKPNSDGPEIRSKVWYSLYVLDRLTALQLGRPPAISDLDCHVPIPSTTGYAADESNVEGAEPGGSKSASEYFICVIEFSSIIGRVLRECYHPRQDLVSKRESTKDCDALLVGWKQGLPRCLRFDLGHAFQNSAVLRRQRNMLAIKFHHLRALIHRPYLYYLRPENAPQIAVENDRSQEYGRICASEAQSIAHLMHHVVDTMDIVMNYPWWQMISCLVCAVSIMVMAGPLLKQEPDSKDRIDTLEEDIETCMDVLKALSENSRGAKLAWDMMKTIRERYKIVSCEGPPDTGIVSLRQNMEILHGENRLEPNQAGYGVFNRFALPSTATDSVEIGRIESNVGFGDAMWPMMMPDPNDWPGSFLDILQEPYVSQEPLGTDT